MGRAKRGSRSRGSRAKKRKFYVPVRGQRGLFLIGGLGVNQDVVSAYAYTQKENAEVFAQMVGEEAYGEPMRTQAISGQRFLGGILINLPSQGADLMCLDSTPFPLTEKGALALSKGPVFGEGMDPDPEKWRHHVNEGTWKRAALETFMSILGHDVEGLDWEGSPEDAARDLHRMWMHSGGSYGLGKTFFEA